ncbi:MAG: hypothetical protein L5655_01495 [Thermosediminibacteraceae bacterium]|nr:hypothetical protein [Thermosediminibacteraceae bacterium]
MRTRTESFLIGDCPVICKGFTIVPVIQVTLSVFAGNSCSVLWGSLVPQALVILDSGNIVGAYILEESFNLQD